jgi:ribose transport system substrate-binding protein
MKGGISQKAAVTLSVIVIVVAIVAGAVGYVLKPAEVATVTAPGETRTVRETVTETVTMTAPKEVIRIAFSPNNLGSPYWRTCLAGALKAVDDINAHFGKEVVSMSMAEYFDDPSKQADHIDMVIAGKYDAYVAPAVEEEPTVASLKRLHDAGIPVVLYDRDTAAGGRGYRLFCTITNNVDAGALEVEKLVEALEASGKPTPWKIAACWGHPGASSAEDRKTGSEMKLNELVAQGKAVIVGTNYHAAWSRDLARSDVETWLVANPDLAAVVCSNDDMALGAVAAVKAAGLTPGKDVFIAGIDAIDEAKEAVKNGEMVVTLAQANYAMAYWGILAAYARVTMGWTPKVDVIPAPLTPVTKANVETFTLEDPKLDYWASYGPTVEQLTR